MLPRLCLSASEKEDPWYSEDLSTDCLGLKSLTSYLRQMEAFIQCHCCQTPWWACDSLHVPHSLFQGPRSQSDRAFAFTKNLAMCHFWKQNYINTQIIPNLLSTDSWLVSSATETQCWRSPATAPWWKSVVAGFSSAHPALGNRWSGSGTCSPCRTCASGPPEGLSPEQWASFLWTR